MRRATSPRRPTPILFRATNFKSIAHGELRPTQLTILAGANSSGKSSLLQALLFVVQSIESDDVVLNGDLVKLGGPEDVIRNGTESMGLDFLWTVPLPSREGTDPLGTTYQMSLELARVRERLTPIRLAFLRDGKRLLQAQAPSSATRAAVPPTVTEAETFLRISTPERYGLPRGTFIGLVGLRPDRITYPAQAERFAADFDQLLEAAKEGDIAAVTDLARLESVPPSESAVTRPATRDSALQKVRELYRSVATSGTRPQSELALTPAEKRHLLSLFVDLEAPDGWRSEPLGPAYIGRGRRVSAFLRPSRELNAEVAGFQWLGRLADRINGWARSIRYLGPLRVDPQVVYPLGHALIPLPVGDKGEFTAGFLAQSRATEINYVDSSGVWQFERLDRAVSRWTTYLAIGEAVQIDELGKLGFSFKLRLNGVDRDLTDVGVGASQLLPVVVLVLGAPSGSTVLLEQPELHLHPAVQSRLGDFFGVARPDVSLALETHSEYIVTRLRLRVARGELQPDQLTVLFAEQSKGETRFRTLRFDDRGDFDYWPPGFFDTLGDDHIEMAKILRDRFGRGKNTS